MEKECIVVHQMLLELICELNSFGGINKNMVHMKMYNAHTENSNIIFEILYDKDKTL